MTSGFKGVCMGLYRESFWRIMRWLIAITLWSSWGLYNQGIMRGLFIHMPASYSIQKTKIKQYLFLRTNCMHTHFIKPHIRDFCKHHVNIKISFELGFIWIFFASICLLAYIFCKADICCDCTLTHVEKVYIYSTTI